MQSLTKIRESVCSNLDEMSVKPRMDRNDIDLVAKMVDIVKDIDTIDAMAEGGYSYEGEWDPGMNVSQRGRNSRTGYGNSSYGSYGNNNYGNGESRRSRTGYMMPEMEYDESRRMR